MEDPGRSLQDWENFFAEEARRGVSMAYFVGAEPALKQERLMAAAPYFRNGNIGTNGTIVIDRAIPFRIGVSIWAGEDLSDKALRGATVFRKALRNYRGDPRAIMLFTVTHGTINQVETVAELCRDHDIPLTFNIYSPTYKYRDRRRQDGEENQAAGPAGRTGSAQTLLTGEDFVRLRKALGNVLERYPETVVYSHAYNDILCSPGVLYQIHPKTGVAMDCGSRIIEPMRYYSTDLKQKFVKCCTPEINCLACRMYSGGWSSRFVPRAADVKDIAAFRRWINIIEILGEIFLHARTSEEEHCRLPETRTPETRMGL